MTTYTVSKFHQNPSRSVKWFLYNSLHIYRELLLTNGFAQLNTMAARALDKNYLLMAFPLNRWSKFKIIVSIVPSTKTEQMVSLS